MASPVRWPWGQSASPIVRARSFAAAGTLTAAGWKPADGNYSNALASIVREAGSGLISWQDPRSSAIMSSTPFDENALAGAWTAAFPHGVPPTDPNPIARIAVAQAVGNLAGQQQFADTYHMLLEPWLNRLDEGQPGQIAALSFAAFDQAEQHDWNWPLRVGIPAPPSLSEQLTAIRGVRRELIELVQQPMSATDVVLLSDYETAALTHPGLAPGLAIVYSDQDTIIGKVDQIAGKISAPTAVIDMSARSMPKFLDEFSDEIHKTSRSTLRCSMPIARPSIRRVIAAPGFLRWYCWRRDRTSGIRSTASRSKTGSRTSSIASTVCPATW